MKIDKSSMLFVALSAVLSSIVVYLLNIQGTAVTWPALDNLPAVCRILDDSCLINDFFTNASSGLTARLPYVYFLSEITRLADNGIGGGLSVIKATLLGLLPALMVFFVFASTNFHTSKHVSVGGDERIPPSIIFTAISAPFLIILLQGRVGSLLSVAWWPPLNFDATAHNVSLLLSLIGFAFIHCRSNLIGAIFVFFGGVVHPAVGLFSSIFSCILFFNLIHFRKNFSLLIFGLAVSILAAVFVDFFLQSGSSLSAQEFVRIYVFEAHPSHYVPSQFGALTRLQWHRSFSIVGVGLLITTITLYLQASAAWRNSFLALIAYISAVACQFFFVEIYQIKTMAILGPSRFTMFGAWFLFIFMFIAISNLLNINVYSIKFAEKFNIVSARIGWQFVGLCGLFIMMLMAYYSYSASSFELPDEDSKKLADFAIKNTNKDDVFVLPPDFPRADFPIKTGRGIFYGNGFPFSEKYFNEWDVRNKMVNGSNAEIKNLPGTWIGEKYAKHYRALSVNDFINAASKYKLDWVVVESEFSNQFSDCKADFESKKYKAYSLYYLKLCAK